MQSPRDIDDPRSHSEAHTKADSVTQTPSPGSRLCPRHSEASTVSSIFSAATDFEAVRPRLFGIAYRILRRPAEAEDVVQDVWIRWQRTDRSGVRDRTAFLVTTTTRVALNVATSARIRHELPIGDGVHEAGRTLVDPAANTELSEALELALARLLERLSPIECAVFVLREAFEYPFRDIARALGLGEPNARQVARRARSRLSGQRRLPVDPGQCRRLLGAFRAASNSGGMTQLEQLLGETVGRPEAA